MPSEVLSYFYFFTPLWGVYILLTRPKKIIKFGLPFFFIMLIIPLLLFDKYKSGEDIAIVAFFLILISVLGELFYEKN